MKGSDTALQVKAILNRPPVAILTLPVRTGSQGEEVSGDNVPAPTGSDGGIAERENEVKAGKVSLKDNEGDGAEAMNLRGRAEEK